VPQHVSPAAISRGSSGEASRRRWGWERGQGGAARIEGGGVVVSLGGGRSEAAVAARGSIAASGHAQERGREMGRARMGRADAARHVEATTQSGEMSRGVDASGRTDIRVYALLFTLLWRKCIPKFELPN
jgi:hypothetical protein